MGKPDDSAADVPSAAATDQAPTPVVQTEPISQPEVAAAGMVFSRLARAVALPSVSQRIVRLESAGPGKVRAILDLTESEVTIIANLD